MSKELEMARELVKMLEEKETAANVKCSQEDCSKVKLEELREGDTFKIGDYDFIVLEQMNNQTAVISKDLMVKNVVFDEDIRDYNKSSLKKLIEEEIQPEIEKEIGADNLVEHEVDLTSVDMQNEFGKCRCKVRPITFDEARKYNNLLANKELGDWWWTCTPWSTEEREVKYSISVVLPDGYFDWDCCNGGSGGVRPFCILKSNIFVSKGE